MTGDDEFFVVVLQVTNHTLVHRLCLSGRVRRQEKQGHILQAFHFWMSRAVVNDERTLSSLSLTRLGELGNPLYEDFASHPGFLVGVILSWEGLDVVEASGFRRFADDQHMTLVCPGHVSTHHRCYSFFTLFTTVAVFVLEFECLVWQAAEEETCFVGIINIIRCVFFQNYGKSTVPLFHLSTTSVNCSFIRA